MYRVALQNFEGPLDLLLFFIKRDEINIRDIPISRITDQFIEYLDLMEELDLEIASEFILMAGTLMSIKAKMLLPREVSDEEEITEDDPRYELVQSLLEYKRYKEMGEDFRELEHAASKEYYRSYFTPDVVQKPTDGEALRDVSLIHLMAAIRDVMLRTAGKELYHEVEKPESSLEEQSRFVLDRLRKGGRVSFIELCSEITQRPILVMTFLSILELIKEGQVVLYVSDADLFEFYLDVPRVETKKLLENA